MNVRIPAAFLATLSAFSAALAQPVSDREAPQLLSAEGFSSTPMVFVPILPCRLVDTRPPYGFTGAYGPPSLVGAATPRTFNIPGGPCPGIPADAGAFSINIGVLGQLDGIDPGYLTVFPTGTPFPPTSDINFSGQTIQNALVVAAGVGGSIDIYVNVSTNIFIDINGYYMPLASVLATAGIPVTSKNLAARLEFAGVSREGTEDPVRFGPRSRAGGRQVGGSRSHQSRTTQP